MIIYKNVDLSRRYRIETPRFGNETPSDDCTALNGFFAEMENAVRRYCSLPSFPEGAKYFVSFEKSDDRLIISLEVRKMRQIVARSLIEIYIKGNYISKIVTRQ